MTILKTILSTVAIAAVAIISQPKNIFSESEAPNIIMVKTPTVKIQAAILLDVSNSMDGLIDQAKAQLWNMVNVMGRAKRNCVAPQIEIALYEYGRSSNDVADGYIKQIMPFSGDLDLLSKKMFELMTNGGDEYCSTVILKSLKELKWDTGKETYKTIFISGNEDFIQGKITYTEACAKAKEMGVIVNTIYCGEKMQGIKEHWSIGTECGNGSYTNINQDAVIEDVATPYDTVLYALNEKLNKTYISYGVQGFTAMVQQAEVDKMNFNANKSAAAKRVAAKGQASVYKNESWDAVDASTADKDFYKKVDMATLPALLQGKSRDEVKKIIDEKSGERIVLQKQIAETSAKRRAFIAADKSTNPGKKQQTLESAVESIIKEQAGRFGMKVE